MSALRDTAAAARVRVSTRADGTVDVYDHAGAKSVGRLHRNPSGAWRGIDDLTGEATPACAKDADALVALLELHGKAVAS